MSINRGMDKEDMVHIYNGILFSHKKDEITVFAATHMDLEIVIVKEETNSLYYFCVEFKSGTNELTSKTESQMWKTNVR